MSPPALVIVGSVVVAVGVTIALHQFVYEPHIAPKLEVFVADWVQRRRTRQRHLAAASYDDEDVPLRGHDHSDTTPVELDTLPTSIRASGVENTVSEHLVQRRRVPGGSRESLMLERPNVAIPFKPLVPYKAPTVDQRDAATRSSTPSTFSSSALDTRSPSVIHESLTAVEGDHSRPSSTGPLTDSLLANDIAYSILSPVHSVTHISPRVPLETISFTSSEEDESSSSSLSLDESRLRRRNTVTYPALHIRPPSNAGSPPDSPGHSIYESALAESPYTPHSFISPRSELPGRANARVSEGGASSGQSTPKSTKSWSDIASVTSDDHHFAIGSDAESWAHVSDRE